MLGSFQIVPNPDICLAPMHYVEYNNTRPSRNADNLTAAEHANNIHLSYVYSKQPMFGLTQEWLKELSFSRLECGVHAKLHISSADWWDILLRLA